LFSLNCLGREGKGRLSLYYLGGDVEEQW
jgi:hypothetical protein